MGCGASKTDKNTQNIDKYLKDERKKLEAEVKLLLLGAGESGKSTVAKQMKIIHLEGFRDEERMSYKSIIYNNVISCMKALVNAVRDLSISLEDNNADAAARLADADVNYFSGSITDQMKNDIKALWADPGVKSAYSRQNEFQLNDSAAYYFQNIDRIAQDNYVPTEQDVLRSRAKTTGIIETEFVLEKTKFKMVDVGGQRSERKKWMHCFQEVTAVIFCVALSEYDLKLYEDDQTNRMHESLKLFKEICNSKWFTDTAMILFLNKRDIFEEKIKKTDLKVCFEEYNGGCNYDNATAFIKDKFLAQNENPKKHIYTHITCATDTDNVQVVFNAVKDVILHRVLDDSGLGIN
jgi:guanine nucleotide-binding protein G(i) subunit alpha